MNNQRVIVIAIICILASSVITYAYTRNEINSQKKLTKRILTNAVKSMESSKEISDSCTLAYKTATACVSNLNTCDIEAEAKKLDEFNYRRGQAEEIIDWMGEDMKEIILEVKASQ